MSEPRKQHYIPVSLLKRFTIDNKIYVTDFIEGKQYDTSPENVAHIRDFYRADVTDGFDENSIEQYFSKTEGAVKSIFDNWIKTMKRPSKQDWSIISEFIAGMHLRGPEMRQKFLELFQYHSDLLNHYSFATKEAYERTCKNYYQDTGKEICIKYEEMKKIIEDPSCLEVRLHQNLYLHQMLKLIPQIAQIISQMTPWLFIATGKSRFITSDNPVILLDANKNKPPYIGSGWLTKTIEVYFPLTPFTCICLMWDREYQVLPFSDLCVSAVNSHLAWFSTRYIFSVSNNICWRKNNKIHSDMDKLFDEMSPSKKDRPLGLVSGPIPQVQRPFSLNKIRKSNFK